GEKEGRVPPRLPGARDPGEALRAATARELGAAGCRASPGSINPATFCGRARGLLYRLARAVRPPSINALSLLGSSLRNSIGASETGWRNFSSHEWSASRRAGSLRAPYFRSPTIGWPSAA